MTLRTLFFLGGASLLSGLEARAHFEICASDAFLIATPRLARYGADERPWAAMSVVQSKSRGMNAVRNAAHIVSALTTFVLRHGPFGRVVLGDLTVGMRFAGLLGRPAEIVVVDDGLGCITVAAERRLRPARLLDRLLDPPAVLFFTAFNVRGRDSDIVVANDYRHLRRAVLGQRSADGWIVGQPMVSNGMLGERDYESALIHASALLDGQPLYVAHPNESDATAARWAQCVGGRVARFDCPLEIQALRRAPQSVVGFCSSALGQLAFLFDGAIPLTSIRIASHVIKRARPTVDAAYAALHEVAARKAGLTVVEWVETHVRNRI